MWYEHWFDDSLARKISMLEKAGTVKLINGRLHVESFSITDNNWMYVAGSTDCRKCLLWDNIFFQQLGVVSNFCRYHCHKVVVRPRNVRELIQMHNLLYVIPYEYNYINPVPGKAGLDTRKYTSEPYGVFLYANSLNEVLTLKEMMKHMITKYIPEEEIDGKLLVDTVFAKRSCTEMEAKYPGDDPWWNTPKMHEEMEILRRLEEIFYIDPDMTFQPAWVKDKILQNWLGYANSIGDKSVVDFVGADIFNVKTRHCVGTDILKEKGGDTTVLKKIKEPEEPAVQEGREEEEATVKEKT